LRLQRRVRKERGKGKKKGGGKGERMIDYLAFWLGPIMPRMKEDEGGGRKKGGEVERFPA